MVGMVAVHPGNHGQHTVRGGDGFSGGVYMLAYQNIRILFRRKIYPFRNGRVFILCGFGEINLKITVVFFQCFFCVLGDFKIDHCLIQNKVAPVPGSSAAGPSVTRIQHDHLCGIPGARGDAHGSGCIGDCCRHLFSGNLLIRRNRDDILQRILHVLFRNFRFPVGLLFGQLLIIQRRPFPERRKIRGIGTSFRHRIHRQIGQAVRGGKKEGCVVFDQLGRLCAGSSVCVLPVQNRFLQRLIRIKLYDNALSGPVLRKLGIEKFHIQRARRFCFTSLILGNGRRILLRRVLFRRYRFCLRREIRRKIGFRVRLLWIGNLRNNRFLCGIFLCLRGNHAGEQKNGRQKQSRKLLM